MAILAAERAIGPVREIRAVDLIATRIYPVAAQELLQRVAVGDVQETESDLEPAVAEREPPAVAPPDTVQVKMRTVGVRADIVKAIVPDDLDIVVQRLDALASAICST